MMAKQIGILRSTCILYVGLVKLYCGFVRRTLEYASVVWRSIRIALAMKLDVIQNSAMRLAVGALPSTPIQVLEAETMVLPLRFRRHRALCEDYAKAHATHPSTVDFSRFMDVSFYESPNGRTRLSSTFTAKNSFNLELNHKISCLLDSKGLIEANISESS